MSALGPRELRAIFGRLMIQILVTGAGVSGAVIESARRRAFPTPAARPPSAKS
jgi:hypothetical protein